MTTTPSPTTEQQIQAMIEQAGRLYQQQEEFYKQLLQQNLGEASYAQFAQGTISWKKAKDSVYLDTTALVKDHPQLCQQYQRSKVGSRRFLVYERPSSNSKVTD